MVESDGPEPLVLPGEPLLVSDEATDEAAEDEDDVDSRASDMLAKVVRPQFGSTSRARLLIWVVILSRLVPLSCLGACT